MQQASRMRGSRFVSRQMLKKMANRPNPLAPAIAVTCLVLGKSALTGAPAPVVIPDEACPLPLSAVRLTGGPLKRAQDLDAEYLLKLEPDRMLFHLRERAGLKPKAERGYGGWDA